MVSVCVPLRRSSWRTLSSEVKLSKSDFLTGYRVVFPREINRILKDLAEDESGARQFAVKALAALRFAVIFFPRHDSSWPEIVNTAWHITQTRPLMTSALYTTILRAINEIKGIYPGDLTFYRFDKVINEDLTILERVATAFTKHVCSQYPETLSIVTLSLSATIEASLQSLFQSAHCPRVTLTILESRPLFEGVHLARSLLPGKPVDATIEIAVDAAGAYFASTADIVLIASDHINPVNGDVKNKIGSVAVARAAKRTLVVSSTDKLRDVEMEEEVEENAPHEVRTVWSTEGDELKGVKVRNLYFEWVSGEDVDGYVTERGILGKEELKGAVQEKKNWEEVWEALDSQE